MCRQLHPEEEEEVAAAGVEAQQLDIEAAPGMAQRAGGASRRPAEIVNAMAKLVDARAELAEARAAMAAPPADAVILDIADDDDPVPSRFDCASDQRGPSPRGSSREPGASGRHRRRDEVVAAARDRACLSPERQARRRRRRRRPRWRRRPKRRPTPWPGHSYGTPSAEARTPQRQTRCPMCGACAEAKEAKRSRDDDAGPSGGQ
ncbi:hypothetical protein QYE76_005540 [Lolium multiflorum]|uniref:Uncharacterized protein n=1 Tax=Lolium multiflorum TaxID=4521 RepID=A0AAD8RU10_LOLMU|nr:hypothetical protein QYE76_005540 [Lolium multiflorum]